MWFAWLRTKEHQESLKSSPTERLAVIAYNVVWWIPLALPIVDVISYRAGFVAFLVITVMRALVNGYRVNVMPVDAAERLPLRSPR